MHAPTIDRDIDYDRRLIILLLIPTLVVGGLFAVNYWTVVTGDEIHLEVVEPVDPRDVFRGQYATLAYSINQIDTRDVPVDDDLANGDTVYVNLVQDGEHWQADRVTQERPTDAAYCIRGEVRHVTAGTVHVRYGIEHFFADPDRARQVEDARWEQNVTGIVSVDNRCNAVLRGVKLGDDVLRTR